MYRINGIKSILSNFAMYNPPCPVVKKNYKTSQQRSDDTIMRHKRKCESELQQPCALAVFFASKEVEHEYLVDTDLDSLHYFADALFHAGNATLCFSINASICASLSTVSPSRAK